MKIFKIIPNSTGFSNERIDCFLTVDFKISTDFGKLIGQNK